MYRPIAVLFMIGSLIWAGNSGGGTATEQAVAKDESSPRVVSGRVSYYGPPYEAPGITASGVSSSEAGIALWTHRDTLGRHYCVNIEGRLSAVLKHIDVGPAPWTNRKIDVTGHGVAKLHGQGALHTDDYGKARLLPKKRGPEWRCGDR